MKVVVVGLGNPIVGDDGIGIKVVEELVRRNALPPSFDVIPDASLGGLPLIELIRGYDKAIIVDAIETKSQPIGTVIELDLTKYQNSLHLSDFHNMDFFTALEFGRQYYEDIPQDITVIGIEIENKLEFSDSLSEELNEKFGQIVEKVQSYINKNLKEITTNV